MIRFTLQDNLRNLITEIEKNWSVVVVVAGSSEAGGIVPYRYRSMMAEQGSLSWEFRVFSFVLEHGSLIVSLLGIYSAVSFN